MDVQTIIRSWKDEDFGKVLSAKEHLPENPAGEDTLTDEDLEDVAGGGVPTSPLCVPDKPTAES